MLVFGMKGDTPHETRVLQGFPRAVLGCVSRDAAVSGRAQKQALQKTRGIEKGNE